MEKCQGLCPASSSASLLLFQLSWELPRFLTLAGSGSGQAGGGEGTVFQGEQFFLMQTLPPLVLQRLCHRASAHWSPWARIQTDPWQNLDSPGPARSACGMMYGHFGGASYLPSYPCVLAGVDFIPTPAVGPVGSAQSASSVPLTMGTG